MTEPIDIPELATASDPYPIDADAVSFVDWILTACIKRAPVMLEASAASTDRPVAWWITSRSGTHHGKRTELATSPSLDHFRMALARIGHRLMADQLYGGFSRVSIGQNGLAFPAIIFMSNDGRTDFWLRAYILEGVGS